MTTNRRSWVTMGFMALTAIGFVLIGMRQAPTAAPDAVKPQSRVAVLNLNYVMKHYKKWEKYGEVYKKKMDGIDEEIKALNVKVDALMKEKATADADCREQLRIQIVNVQDIMEARIRTAKKELEDLESEHFPEIYKGVELVAKRYATEHGVQMVIHFSDGTTEKEANTFTKIRWKMGQGALFPIYLAPGVDISKEIVAMLNEEKAPDDK
jgi:Skp family chaperone for outer membrane proteins